MPFYRVGGLVMHVRMSGKAPPPCRAPIELDGKLVACCGISGFACDEPLESGGTCSMPLCDEHATQIGRDEHLCPRHAAARAERTPELF